MGNSEEGKACKPEKPSSPAPDQTSIHVYPDWAAMQAYYGPRFAVPPYFNSAVASGHAPHPYMWGPPQAMMPPYAAIYAHGGVYAHLGVPLAATASSMDTPTKSEGNTDRGLMKKLKECAMSIGGDNAEDGAYHGVSQSAETEGSSDGSDGNMAGVGQNGKKRSREGTPTVGGDGKMETRNSPVPSSEVSGASNKAIRVTAVPASVAGKVLGNVLSPSMATTALELRNTPSANPKTNSTSVPQPCVVMPNEVWLKNERELKREKRKQSNRESARRSRLRKQAESEELAKTVESLTTENMSLKTEITRLTDNSKKVKLENITLMDKLKNPQLQEQEEVILSKADDNWGVNTKNLLSRVHNSGSFDGNGNDSEMHENNSNSSARLRPLLDTSSRRANAVGAG
ncbi:common plant regulatory factor 1-like isoform X2 [Cornus florida]|uniref:common plant regulatory factor 1-like isoform X2 n=1 Tax=Cornus florida TaxID=4283 RepID=UPI00289906B5|nr:common plant regulatory factor 1-like isoform X2 [Cornus florida]